MRAETSGTHVSPGHIPCYRVSLRGLVAAPDYTHRTHRKNALTIAIIALLLCGPVCAQSRVQTGRKTAAVTGDTLEAMAELNFEVMGLKEGLPHASIYSFAQDKTGYLWIATFGGLARYSGYHARTYTQRPGVAGSLPDNNVRVLVAKDDGGLWVGTGSAGLVIYNPAKDDFEVPENTPQILRTSRVFCIAPDGEGGAWFGTQYGLAHYVARTKSFEMYSREAHTPGFPTGGVFSVLVDSQHTLWVGTETGLLMKPAGTAQFIAVPGLAGAGELGEQSPIWAIFEDHAGKIWIGSDLTGIGTVDRSSMRVRGAAQLAGTRSLIGAHTVRGFLEAPAGVLWVATYGGGLVRVDTNNGSIHRWTKDPTAAKPLSNDFLRCIFRDRAGEIWLGTDDGVSKFNAGDRGIFDIHSSPLRPKQLFGTEVRSVTAGYGRVVVGFDQGGFAIIEGDGSIHRALPAPGMSAEDESRREVLSLKPAGDGTFMAGGAGLYTIDAKSRTYRAIENPMLKNQIINGLWVDGDTVWAGSYNGLMRYNRRTGALRVFSHDVSDPASLADNYVRDIFKAHDGRLWITTRLGLDLYDAKTETFQHFRHSEKDPHSPASDNLQPMAEDNDGRLWIGTIGAGLTILESWPQGGQPQFKTISTHDGLPGDVVLTITRGLDGRMWVNTLGGLASINPKDGDSDSYSEADGLETAQQNLFSSAMLEDGTILFPGTSSLVLVRPEQLKKWTYAAPLVLTSVTLPGVHTSPIVLAEAAMAGRLSFASHQGFHADFALLDFTYPANTMYSYRLNGFDGEWSESSTIQQGATYTNLAQGRYTFEVTANSRGGHGPTSSLTIPIEVTSRFYETGWFRALSVLVVVAGTIIFARIRISYVTKQHKALEFEIAERTTELKVNQMELMRANERLAQLAQHDTLTGILNRRGFFERAELEVVRSVRNGRTFSLVLADLDDFKAINDTYGHIAGDHCLRSIAQVMAANLRPTDLIARYGGEELIMLLPETNEESALKLAERLRQAVAELALSHNARPIRVTISLGVTSAREGKNLDALIADVDRALYAAKHGGKNQVRTVEQAVNE